jgi:hypothetical protein
MAPQEYLRGCRGFFVRKRAEASARSPGGRWGRVCRVALRVALVLAVAEFCWAAELPGRVRGVVSRADGGGLRGATVELTRREGGVVVRTRTRRDGGYEFAQVAAGEYSLTVQQPGFQTYTVCGIRLGAGAELVRNFAMLPGSMTKAVLVEAGGDGNTAAPSSGSSR